MEGQPGPSRNAGNLDLVRLEMADRDLMNSNIRHVLNCLEGTMTIFKLRSVKSHKGAMISTMVLLRATVMLRLQYIEIFMIHFRAIVKYEHYYKSPLYKEYKMQLCDFRRNLDQGDEMQSFHLMKRLVQLTELLLEAFKENLETWQRNKWGERSDGTIYSIIEHAVKIMAHSHNVSLIAVINAVGLKLGPKCRCPREAQVPGNN